MNVKLDSPFFPGNPVPTELFVGRSEQIEQLLNYIGQIVSGKQENIFLSGERGIGKSSLASFVRQVVSRKHDVIGIHVFLGGVHTLEEMVQHILARLLKEGGGQLWFNKIEKLFAKHIKRLGLFGISVEFSPPEEEKKALVRNFPEVLWSLLEKLKDDKKGLFIILDDINGLAESVDFANWYKTFVDTIATHYKSFPVTIMLTGLPEKRDSLASLQPSLMRIFRPIDIQKLSDSEVKDFISRAFKQVNIEVEPEAMDVMALYSSGLPILMHEIGDAVYWIDQDDHIDVKDAKSGILKASENVGTKYLDATIYRAIRSEKYRTILRELGGQSPRTHFSKSEIEKKLAEKEKKVFHNFLEKFKELGIIESDVEKGRGAYKFVNRIYPVYIFMESKLYDLRKKNKKMK